MKILLTGVTGFIGTRVLKVLTKKGHQVTGLALTNSFASGCKIIGLNLVDKQKVAQFLKHRRFDCIVHLAAAVPRDFAGIATMDSMRANFTATLNLLEEFATSETPTFIHASSITAPAASNFYSLGKLFEEITGQLTVTYVGKNVVSLRIGAPFGPGQTISTVVSLFLQQAMQGTNLTVLGSGKREQDYVYVDDIAELIASVLRKPTSGIFNTAGGRAVSTNTLAKTIIKLTGSSSKIVHRDRDPQENKRGSIDISETCRQFGYKPRPLAAGLTEYIKHLRSGGAK